MSGMGFKNFIAKYKYNMSNPLALDGKEMSRISRGIRSFNRFMQRNENSLLMMLCTQKGRRATQLAWGAKNTKHQKVPLEQEIKAGIKILIFNEISLLPSTDSEGYTGTLILVWFPSL